MIERLADARPGPRLATALASFDVAALSDDDLLTILQAQARQLAHEQARLLTLLAAVGDRSPEPEFAADEIAAALAWTRKAAEAQLALAYEATRRLPDVWAALDAGTLDLPKARIVCDAVATLDDEKARAVAAEVLPDAGRLTTGQLRARLTRMVLKADPETLAARHQRAVAGRRVVLGAEFDGTAMLAGYGLPPDRAAAAMANISALVASAKAAGDARTMDQLRADMMLDLLAGVAGNAPKDRRKAVIELRVDLATLAKLTEEPGDLSGFGPVAADIARRIARENRDATWRWMVYTPTGAVQRGTTRRRPRSVDQEAVMARDDTCRAPGCRIPARLCDIDHTIPWAVGGPTETRNLGALCRHHHRMKDGGPWRLRQIREGVFAWISPMGRTYLVGPDPP